MPYSPAKGLTYVVLGRTMIFISVIYWVLEVVGHAMLESQIDFGPTSIVGLLLVWVVSPWAVKLVRRGKRLLIMPVDQLLKRDKRPPVLYLRSFTVDAYRKMTRTRVLPFVGVSPDIEITEYEEDLAGAVSIIGPMIAIADPNDTSDRVGAARVSAIDSNWRDAVRELSSSASLVVIRPGTTPGIYWELASVVKRGEPRKLILFCAETPPTSIDRLFPKPLPEIIDGDVHFIAFDDQWNPRLLRMNWWSRFIRLGSIGSQKHAYQYELRYVIRRLGAHISLANHLGALWIHFFILVLLIYVICLVLAYMSALGL